MASRNALAGSAVMRHIVDVADVLKELGIWLSNISLCPADLIYWRIHILFGFSRFWSTMCFFVLTTIHTGASSTSVGSSSSPPSVARRFGLLAFASCFLICVRSTLHACVVCGMSSWYGDLESALATWSDMLQLGNVLMYFVIDVKRKKVSR